MIIRDSPVRCAAFSALTTASDADFIMGSADFISGDNLDLK
jgi:hypothetical protein